MVIQISKTRKLVQYTKSHGIVTLQHKSCAETFFLPIEISYGCSNEEKCSNEEEKKDGRVLGLPSYLKML